MLLQRFMRDSAAYGLGAIASRGISLLLLPFYTRVFAPADYGILDLLLILTALVNLTVALEISQGVARHFPDAESDGARAGYASTGLWFTVAAYAVFTLGMLLFAAPVAHALLGSAAHAPLVRVAAAAMAANGVFYLLQNQLRWMLRAWTYAAASLLYASVSALTTVLLILLAGAGLSAFFVGQAAGALAGGALAFHTARRHYGWTFDVVKCREMLSFAAPLVPSGIAVFVSLYVDRLAISRLLTMADVGVYGVGFRVSALAGLLLLGFQGALSPLIYQHYREEETPGEIARIFRSFLALMLSFALALTLFAPEIVRVAAPPDYFDAVRVVPLLVAAAILHTMYIFAPGLSIAKRTGTIAGINAAAAAANLVLNLLLIPIWGIVGAAVATAVSALGAFALYMVWSQRLYPVPHDWKRIGSAAASVLVLAAAVSALPLRGTAASEPAALLARLLVAAAASLLVLFLATGSTRLLRLRTLLGRG